jgi:uncharacterized protein (DUF849 family)
VAAWWPIGAQRAPVERQVADLYEEAVGLIREQNQDVILSLTTGLVAAILRCRSTLPASGHPSKDL